MRKLTAASGAVLIACALWADIASAETITKDEYRKRAIVLFKELLIMKTEGVFSDCEFVESLRKAGVKYPNRIRGNNPPCGFFARPPGSTWYKRFNALRNTGHKFVCFDIPKLPSGVGVCGHDLFRLWIGANDLSRGKVLAFDSISAKFWLATICYENPDACKPYINE